MADLSALSELQPESVEKLTRLNSRAREAVDTELLDLCTRRAAEMLSGESDSESGEVSPRERAYLDFTEQFVTSVGDVSAEQVDELLEHSSAAEVYAFAGALYAAEMTTRVEIVSAVVLR